MKKIIPIIILLNLTFLNIGTSTSDDSQKIVPLESSYVTPAGKELVNKYKTRLYQIVKDIREKVSFQEFDFFPGKGIGLFDDVSPRLYSWYYYFSFHLLSSFI